MHLLFLDESGQLAERKFFALGGIALRDSDWPVLRDLWLATLAGHGWPAEREVKWHGIRKGEVPPALADALIRDAGTGAIHGYVSLLDMSSASARRLVLRAREDTYATGLMFLAERFQLLLQSEDDSA